MNDGSVLESSALPCAVPTCNSMATGGAYCERHCEEASESTRRFRDQHVAIQRPSWLDMIGLPRRYWAATFADSRPTTSIKHVLAYRDARGLARGRAFIACGPTGVGKTHAIACLVNEILPFLTARQRFVLGAQFMRQLLDFRTSADAMETAAQTYLLIIDDLQAPTRPEALTLLEEVLVRREADRLPVMISTNLRRAQLEAALGDRLSDRLRAWGTFAEVPGRSLREGAAS